MTSGIQSELCCSNDFEIIDEPNRVDHSDRNGSEVCQFDMDDTNDPKTNTLSGDRKNMLDATGVHIKREVEWYREKETLLSKIQILEENYKKESKERNEQFEKRLQEQIKHCATLKSKNSELESAYEAEKCKNVELCKQIKEMKDKEAQNMTQENKYIEELNKNLQRQKALNKELQEINDQLEQEQNEMRSTKKELQNLDERRKEENAKLYQRVEEIKRSNDDLKGKWEIQIRQCETLQHEKEKLEEELIEIKLEYKKVESREREIMAKYEHSKSHYTTEIENLSQAITVLTKESDVLGNRCKELERENNRIVHKELQSKENTAQEIQQINKVLKAVNEEKEEVLRRNEDLETESIQIKSGKKLLETKIEELNDELAKLKEKIQKQSRNDGSDDNRQTDTQSMPAPYQHNTSAEQWYLSNHGESVLNKIYQKLKEPFPTTELFRDVNSKDIGMSIKMDQNKKAEIKFPNDFPNSSLLVKLGSSKSEMKFVCNRTSTVSTFATEVANGICQMICGQD